VTVLVAAIAGVYGLVIGSFLNVVIWRVPRHESLVKPGSHCPGCAAPIAPRDNIPVLSWLLLRGRCRNCGEPISIRYPFVELLTAVLFAAVGARFYDSWALPAFLLLTAALIAISAIDLEFFIIPNRIVYPVGIAGAILLFAAAAIEFPDWSSFGSALLGAAGAFTFFFILHLVAPGGMASADVRLLVRARPVPRVAGRHIRVRRTLPRVLPGGSDRNSSDRGRQVAAASSTFHSARISPQER